MAAGGGAAGREFEGMRALAARGCAPAALRALLLASACGTAGAWAGRGMLASRAGPGRAAGAPAHTPCARGARARCVCAVPRAARRLTLRPGLCAPARLAPLRRGCRAECWSAAARGLAARSAPAQRAPRTAPAPLAMSAAPHESKVSQCARVPPGEPPCAPGPACVRARARIDRHVPDARAAGQATPQGPALRAPAVDDCAQCAARRRHAHARPRQQR